MKSILGKRERKIYSGLCRIKKMQRIFILLPSNEPTGPIKGGFALANSLIEHFDVNLVILDKKDEEGSIPIDPGVRFIDLSSYGNLIKKSRALKGLLTGKSVAISMCFSADLVNAFSQSNAIKISSVRGNLYANYSNEYGISGHLLALLHLMILRKFDRVVAMNGHMAGQVRQITRSEAVVIGNFVDESSLASYTNLTVKKNQCPVFAFVGSLTNRKQPFVALNALRKLHEWGIKAKIHFLGDGPLKEELHSMVQKHNLGHYVQLHGFVQDPLSIVTRCDVMVLPSLSEGISRAVMESLFVGIPCIIRDVDGNSEIVQDGINGYLFEDEEDLPKKMNDAFMLSCQFTVRQNLLPQAFKRDHVIKQYVELFEKDLKNTL